MPEAETIRRETFLLAIFKNGFCFCTNAYRRRACQPCAYGKDAMNGI
jgi:hypothetical protein